MLLILKPQASSLTPFLVGLVGVEATPCGLKVRRAACYTTTLNLGAAYAFQSTYRQHGKLPLLHTSNFTLPPSSVRWEVLEPSSAAFQATAKPSQLTARQPVVLPPRRSAASAVLSPAQQKNPMPCDTGFALGISPRRDWRHKRNGCADRRFAAQLLNR